MNTNNYVITELNKTKWKGHILPIAFTSDEEYHLEIRNESHRISMSLEKKKLTKEVISIPEYHDYSDRLFNDHWDNPRAFGILIDDELVAAIELAEESWNNRLRVTELWVSDEYQRQGIGHALMNKAVEIAKESGSRALVLETQSSNVKAIDFYFKNEFELIGFDTIHYSNEDRKEHMVRLELGRVLK